MSLRSSRVIEVRVVSLDGKTIPNAIVTARPVEKDAPAPLHFEERTRIWTGALDNGAWRIRAEAPGLEADDRTVNVSDRGLQAMFILGRAGLPFYYRGGAKVPFDVPGAPVVAVSLKPGMESRAAELDKVAEELHLTPVPAPAVRRAAAAVPIHPDLLKGDPAEGFGVKAAAPRVKPQQTWTYSAPSGAAQLAGFERRARALPFVRRAGQVVHQSGGSMSFLTDDIVVRFRDGVNGEAAARAKKLEPVQQLKPTPNMFLLRTHHLSSRELLELCNRWAEDPDVLVAEPSIAHTVTFHFTPDDLDPKRQLHHAFIRTEPAWDLVRAHLSAYPATALPLIAVIDEGCEITHPDLAPNLSGAFNFHGLNQNLFASPHGTKTAGVAAAVYDNGKGIAGVAGMCPFMAIQLPDMDGTDHEYANMFKWCAGIDPGDPYLPPPPNPGADVLSNSWGLGAIGPLPAVISDALDEVTGNGRGGLGCVVVFSAGNEGDDMMIHQPLAAHPNVIAVGSSTVGLGFTPDTRAPSSNFGLQLDLCAPGGDVGGSTFSTTAAVGVQPAKGVYEVLGQTSCACPQVAGAAALLLVLDPSMSAAQVRDILQQSAAKIDQRNGNYDASGHSQLYGFGRLDVCAALQAV